MVPQGPVRPVVRWLVGVLFVGTVVGLFSGPSAPPAKGEGKGRLTVTAESSRPDVVSGDDALVRVSVPSHLVLQDVRVALNGRDVTERFRPTSDGGDLLGLVRKVRRGANTLTASAPDERAARLVLKGHPATGPVFSGPHEKPFVCDTAAFRTVTGQRLGRPRDADCSVRTRVVHLYRTTGGKFVRLPHKDARPDDMETTTTSTGEKVPYIVRVETGTRNRGVYETAVLHDPRSGPPDPRLRATGWNGRLVYGFGGGCAKGWYVQGRRTDGVLKDDLLRKGYAVASSSLNVFGNNCNDLLAAETVSMVKERFVETYGPPAFTIGSGCSGGSYQTHQIADNYPGLLDGVLSGCSFPDVGFGTVSTVSDALLLDRYFGDRAPKRLRFSKEQQRAVSGFGEWRSIARLATEGRRIDPTAYCPARLPRAQRYARKANRDGARCDVFSHAVNVYGRDPRTGLVRRPLDNTGIQYGLRALNKGTIDVNRFLDLNARVGGLDADARHTSRRTAADPEATRRAYRTGRMLNGGGGLADVPIIDYRDYTDDAPGGDLHLRFHSFSTRARLDKANGTHANQVMLVRKDGRGFSLADLVADMDRWLTGIKGDDSADTPIRKIVRHKPEGLTDACWTRGTNPRKISEPQVAGTGTTACNTLYPVWPSPRMVAGAGVANDVVTCRKRPVSRSDYSVRFTDKQFDRLRRLFPDGVCDWSKPGAGQRGLAGTWQSFGGR
ncbi:DUF6351 family protein [Streptomyces sp. NPDC048172]|uniref:DUF6351 family protein n=1 Tax=Streptomyces sp. NPDC048172 TaxID=3365505 RepID=UPI00371E0B2C